MPATARTCTQDLYVVPAAGLRHYLACYPKAARPLGVRPDANGTPHGMTTAAHPLVVVRVHLDRR